MTDLRQFRVQFIDDEGGAEDIDVLTSAKSVSLQNGKTVQALFDEGGLNGTMWHIGTSAPSSSLGKDKDFYMNKTTYDIYIKQSGQWGLVGNIKGSKGDPGQQGTPGAKGEPGTPGQKGDPGTPGAKGADGATWLFGTSVPSSQGKTGDFYLKTDTFDIYSKATGSWVKTGNIKGAKGDPGQQGQPGAKGEPGDSIKIGASYEEGTPAKIFFKLMN